MFKSASYKARKSDELFTSIAIKDAINIGGYGIGILIIIGIIINLIALR